MIDSIPANPPGQSPQFLTLGHGELARRIAYRILKPRDAAKPGIVWLGGFRSDMKGGKATALEQHAGESGRGFLRFDYSGHGESEGRFEDGKIGRWLEESLAVIRTLTKGPQVLVGSSMGGWLSLLVARALAESGEAGRIAGHVLIAPAVDFTQALMWPSLSASARKEIETNGVWMRPSAYSDAPYPITRGLIEEGRNHLLLDKPLRSYGPVHILQGMQDPDVPFAHALTIVEHFAEDPVALTLIKDGDHRLSRPEDIGRLLSAIDRLLPPHPPSAV